MKARVLMSEEVELAIFDCIAAGEFAAKIARKMDCDPSKISRLKTVGRPRWRHRANGELHPSPAVIAWHCCQIRRSWTDFEEIARRVVKPEKYGTPVILEAGLGLAPNNSALHSEESPL